jgi:AraC-like DNA-binding protein
VRLEIQGKHATLSYIPVELEDLPSQRQIVELAIGVGMQLMRTLLGSRWQPQAVLMQHTPACEPNAYRRYLGLVPQFNSHLNAQIFDAQLLETPLGSADEGLHKLLQQHLDTLEQLSIQELPAYVQQSLRNFLPNGRVTIGLIADYMALSTRTLQRYLAEDGTSFQVLLDQTRQSMANRYLCDSSISLTQLAGMLGYSDLSAFSRAFQRWFGMSPRAWQKQQNPDQSTRRLRPRLQRRVLS